MMMVTVMVMVCKNDYDEVDDYEDDEDDDDDGDGDGDNYAFDNGGAVLPCTLRVCISARIIISSSS